MAVYIIPITIISLVIVWSIGTFLYEKHLERPSYLILEKRHGYEFRMYEPYIVAEADVSGDYEQASSVGFGILAGYIFGNNIRREKIAMTAPVAMEKKKAYEKISMTVPVLMKPKDKQMGETYTMSFMMPSKYTIETLPKPGNPAVKLRSVQKRKVAVIRFSLFANSDRIKKKTAELKKALGKDGFTAVSEPEIARYNAPFSNPLLRRNEILIEFE
jgi:hypothetical protein